MRFFWQFSLHKYQVFINQHPCSCGTEQREILAWFILVAGLTPSGGPALPAWPNFGNEGLGVSLHPASESCHQAIKPTEQAKLACLSNPTTRRAQEQRLGGFFCPPNAIQEIKPVQSHRN